MDINANYKDLWQNKEDAYRILNFDEPIVIFMDGKAVTNNHKRFPMLGKENNFAKRLMECGEAFIKEINIDAILYAGIDELSIIVLNPKDMIYYFGVGDNIDYISTIFIQKFIERFWEYYKCYFKNITYNIKEENISRYLQYRKDVCYSGGLWYIAKEYLPKDKYRGLDFDEMIELLKKENLWDVFLKEDYIHEGYMKKIKKDEFYVLNL